MPEAEIIHVHEETTPSIFNRYRREAMAFKQIYPEEKFGLGDFLRLFTLNALNDWQAAARQGVLRRNFRAILQFRYLQFYGTYQGYQEKGPLTWKLRKSFYYPGLEAGLDNAAERDISPIQYFDD